MSEINDEYDDGRFWNPNINHNSKRWVPGSLTQPMEHKRHAFEHSLPRVNGHRLWVKPPGAVSLNREMLGLKYFIFPHSFLALLYFAFVQAVEWRLQSKDFIALFFRLKFATLHLTIL
jgi:hypothetical protein